MLTPSIGCCWTPSHGERLRNARGLEDRRRDVDHVVELRADLAVSLEPVRPVHDGAVAGPAQCDATCLVHWYGVFMACAQPTA